MTNDTLVAIPWNPHETPQGIYRRLFFARRKKLTADIRLPRITCSAKAVRISPDHLSDYRFVTMNSSANSVPLFYPHALFGSAHLQMIAHPRFPLRASGLLHLRNHVVQYCDLDVDSNWNLRCELTRQRNVEKGLEFDFDSTVEIDGEVAWQSVSTYLKRGNTGGTEASELAGIFHKIPDSEEVGQFGIPHNIGKRYAKVTGDYNPIHVSNLAAKLFGFKRAIAHGMWSIARALSELPKIDGPIRHDVAFKGPMLVNSHAAIRSDSQTNSNGRFDIFCGSNPRPVVVGIMRQAERTERIV